MKDNNENNIRVSVAMAVYNSEKYVRPQIDSIIKQLGQNDELVISYNPSGDSTFEIISEYADRDSRVRVIVCNEAGLVSNFNSAIANTRGKYIFLSDHDDVWVEDKIKKVVKKFESGDYALVLHGRYVTDANLNVIGLVEYKNIKTRVVSNLIKNHFCGSCMAFRRDILGKVYPIPAKGVFHDAWIGIIASYYGQVGIIHEPLMYYRRHDGNLSVSKRRKISVILRERFLTAVELLKRTCAI